MTPPTLAFTNGARGARSIYHSHCFVETYQRSPEAEETTRVAEVVRVRSCVHCRSCGIKVAGATGGCSYHGPEGSAACPPVLWWETHDAATFALMWRNLGHELSDMTIGIVSMIITEADAPVSIPGLVLRAREEIRDTT